MSSTGQSIYSSDLQTIEEKLEELTNATLRLEHETERVELLQKKKAWLDFDAQNKHITSLIDASEMLKEQQA